MEKVIRIFIADDHQMFIDGIKALLESTSSIVVSGSALNGKELIAKLHDSPADIVLMDIGMPVMDGIEATMIISEKFPEIKVIALSMYDDQHKIKKMLKAGAKGYVLKNTSKKELINAIEVVSGGTAFYSDEVIFTTMNAVANEEKSLLSQLTDREIEIIRLIVRSLTNKEISEQLHISELTVNTHRKNAMRKLSIKNTAGLVKFALEQGL